MFFIVIFGPTGVGKTDFALQLARKLPAEMINADLGQFYVPLSIGTAKPPLETLELPTHLFDIIDQPIDLSVMQYREKLVRCIPEIIAKHKIPIIVGGSGFYISSIFFPPLSIDQSATSINVPNNESSWQALYNIDPDRAKRINPNDYYRIRRALDIWYTTKQRPSERSPVFDSPGNFLFIMLTRERADLYERINQRVITMFEQGWINEVVSLKKNDWSQFIRNKKIIGYTEILNYLESPDMSQDQLIAIIAQKTRNYAKRQLSFGRMLSKKLMPFIAQNPNYFVESLNLTFTDIDLYIETLIEKCKILVSR